MVLRIASPVAASIADGWMPLIRGAADPTAKIAELHRRAAEAGHDPASISVTIVFANPDGAWIDRMEAAGVERLVFGLPAADASKILPLLDSYAKVMP